MIQVYPDLILVQRRMEAIGLYSGPIDGEWGPGTRTGVERLLAIAEGLPHEAAPAPAPLPKLPATYSWIANVGPLPRHLQAMLSLYGTRETPGAPSNPVILQWAKDLGGDVAHSYLNDGIPWCGLAMAHAMQLAGRTPADKPLWALSWATWGQDGGQPELGDVLVFIRDGGGHVALYVGEDAGNFHILGGNQGDAVSIMRIAKTRLKACRQPPYQTKPACVRPYKLSATGSVSENER